MKIETLRDRITKANERIAKKQVTIAKKQAWIVKKRGMLDKLDKDERIWAESDIENWQEDIARLTNEIEETQKMIESYEKQLTGEVEKAKRLSDVPETLKAMQSELVARWDRYDKEHRDYLRRQYSELGFSEFIKQHHWSAYNAKDQTDEQIHRENVQAAKDLILNLIDRVQDRVGEITDWRDVRMTGGTGGCPVLNGFVTGKQGRCMIESIGAGGYNVQRYHIRVLVHDCN